MTPDLNDNKIPLSLYTYKTLNFQFVFENYVKNKTQYLHVKGLIVYTMLIEAKSTYNEIYWLYKGYIYQLNKSANFKFLSYVLIFLIIFKVYGGFMRHLVLRLLSKIIRMHIFVLRRLATLNNVFNFNILEYHFGLLLRDFKWK